MPDTTAKNPSRRPTIVDVAKACGLSKGAVSRILNLPSDQCPFAPETRQRVLNAVESIGYRPSWYGRSLAKRRSGMVGVVYVMPASAMPAGIYSDIVDHLDNLLDEQEIQPIFIRIRSNDDPRFERMLRDQRLDGVISLGPQSRAALDYLREHRVPAVLVNSHVDDSWTRVNVDDRQGATDAMRHLLDLGHRRIVYYAGHESYYHPTSAIRAEAYKRTMLDAGLEPAEPFLGPVKDFVGQVIDGSYRPTAVLAFSHWTSIRLLQQLWRRGGVRVPQDLSLVTFNDTYPVDAVTPPLTVMALPAERMGFHAVRMLRERIDNPDLAPETVVLKETLVVRESAAPPPPSPAPPPPPAR